MVSRNRNEPHRLDSILCCRCCPIPFTGKRAALASLAYRLGPLLCASSFGAAETASVIVKISEADHGSLAQTQSDGFPIPRPSYRLDGRVGGTGWDAGCSFDSRARVSALSASQHGQPVLRRCHGRINDGSEDQRTHLRSLQRHGLPGD